MAPTRELALKWKKEAEEAQAYKDYELARAANDQKYFNSSPPWSFNPHGKPGGIIEVSDPSTVFAPEKPKAILGTQVGGTHYTDCAIQPIEYIWANKLEFSEGNIVKYVTRWKSKGGIKDLRKANHHLALKIEEAEAEEARTGVKYGL